MTDMRVDPAAAAPAFGVVGGNASPVELLLGAGPDVLTGYAALLCSGWAGMSAAEALLVAGNEDRAGDAGTAMIGTFVQWEALNTETLTI